MPIIITDDYIEQSSFTEEEFREEMALLLYSAGLLNFGKARELANLDILTFLELCSRRKIEMPYTGEDFEEDLRVSKKIRLPS